MSKLLLLIHSESDVQHLDAAAQAILRSGITGVWCVFSPAITVNASEAASKLDGEIGQLRTAERAAADRSDYEAAAGYKAQREGKELDRAKAVRDAWKTASEEDRKAKVNALFAPFLAALQPRGVNVRVSGHSDHYEREQWVSMLNSLSGVWFKPFTPGSFVVAWPESINTSIKVVGTQRWAEVVKEAEVLAGEPSSSPTEARRAELEALHPMKLSPLMRTMGLDGDGKTRAEKIDAILAHESKPAEAAREPEMAGY